MVGSLRRRIASLNVQGVLNFWWSVDRQRHDKRQLFVSRTDV